MKLLVYLLTLLMVMTYLQQPPTNWFRPDGNVNWEAEKQPTDTIVIHHTAEVPGATWQGLSELQYQTLYVPRYASHNNDPDVFGRPPHSGHFRQVGSEKVEVFYAYHWLIRANGDRERLLADDEVGWHSGNWEMNCRSIAICFDGDFSTTSPSDAAIRSASELIRDYQKKFKITQVLGHNDVRSSTTCPGPWFRQGGKERLLVFK